MRRYSRRAALRLLGCGVAAPAIAPVVASSVARAQAGYPNRPINLIVGFAAGGGTDIIARLVAAELSKELGQQIVVENRAGASGTIAAGVVARAEPDGYTMMMGHVSSNAMVPAVMASVPYDPATAFTPIMTIGTVAQVLTVPANSPARSVADFIRLLKERPGKLSYASSGIGTQQHLAAEMFKQATGTDMAHVPYRGSGQAVNDLITGNVDVNFDTMPTVLPHLRSGALRGLGVTTAKRAPIMPDLPTIAESGVPGFDVDTWYMVMGPKGLPAEIVTTWSAGLAKLLNAPAFKKRLEDLATDVGGGTPADAQALLARDIRKWADLVKTAGIRG